MLKSMLSFWGVVTGALLFVTTPNSDVTVYRHTLEYITAARRDKNKILWC